MTAMKASVSKSPGTMPAMKRSPIEIWASTPKITNSIDGGMIGDKSPPAAVVAAANGRL